MIRDMKIKEIVQAYEDKKIREAYQKNYKDLLNTHTDS